MTRYSLFLVLLLLFLVLSAFFTPCYSTKIAQNQNKQLTPNNQQVKGFGLKNAYKLRRKSARKVNFHTMVHLFFINIFISQGNF